jgi:hypothetical protein
LLGNALNCVILQPSYIPWRGFFHQVQKADLFIFYDDVQYDKRGWRNRNRIKTAQGSQWLTIPVYARGAQVQNIPINQVHVTWDEPWNEKHWKTIRSAYHKAPFFNRYAPLFEEMYLKHPDLLADFTIEFTIRLARELGNQHTRFMRSSELGITGKKTERLINLLKSVGASHYISGPSARDYIETNLFEEAGISLEYMEYDYPEYAQLYPPFDPFVSVIDLLFMVGPEAPNLIYS